jgi:hypothetical protein
MGHKQQSQNSPLEWVVVDQAIDRRLVEITAWLRDNQVFEADPERMGSVERAYWHYGYLSALQDLRALLARKTQTRN